MYVTESWPAELKRHIFAQIKVIFSIVQIKEFSIVYLSIVRMFIVMK